MITSKPLAVAPSVVSVQSNSARQLKLLALLTFVLIACFNHPLYSLLRFALHSDLYSHIVLIPFVSIYLVWLQRKNLAPAEVRYRAFALLPLLLGAGLLIAFWSSAAKIPAQNYLALMTSSFLCFFMGTYLFLFGSANLRALSFPLAFLIFMIPFPTTLEHPIESFLQSGSASAACGLFKLFGMPVFKQEMELHLPGFSMQVAPECSGIHSSLVLFVTSLVASHLLLRAYWGRTFFVLAVVPLAMFRNGFRIFVLGELCVQLDPAWIHSALHHRGGPIFFALSLIPFFLLLLLLRKFECRKRKSLPLTPHFSAVPESAEVNATVSTVSSVDSQPLKRQ